MPEVATVSARAFIGRLHAFKSLVKCGTRPQVSRSRDRSPVSGCRRTTAARCVGATFQLGARFGSAPRMPNIRAICSRGRVLAKRPHIGAAWRELRNGCKQGGPQLTLLPAGGLANQGVPRGVPNVFRRGRCSFTLHIRQVHVSLRTPHTAHRGMRTGKSRRRGKE
jgi:hypothetical protein